MSVSPLSCKHNIPCPYNEPHQTPTHWDSVLMNEHRMNEVVRNSPSCSTVPLDWLTKQKFTVNSDRKGRAWEDGGGRWVGKGGPRLSLLSEIPRVLSSVSPFFFPDHFSFFSGDSEHSVSTSSLNHTVQRQPAMARRSHYLWPTFLAKINKAVAVTGTGLPVVLYTRLLPFVEPPIFT